MKLAFDIDGTVADVVTTLTQRLRTEYYIDLDTIEITCFEFIEKITIPGTAKFFLEYWYAIMENHWKGILPYAGSEVLYKFQPVTFITARRPVLRQATTDWIDWFFPQLDYDVWFFRSMEKSGILHDTGFSGIVEDRLKVANHVAENGLRSFLVNRSWNMGRYTHPNVIRLNNLKEIIQWVE